MFFRAVFNIWARGPRPRASCGLARARAAQNCCRSTHRKDSFAFSNIASRPGQLKQGCGAPVAAGPPPPMWSLPKPSLVSVSVASLPAQENHSISGAPRSCWGSFAWPCRLRLRNCPNEPKPMLSRSSLSSSAAAALIFPSQILT